MSFRVQVQEVSQPFILKFRLYTIIYFFLKLVYFGNKFPVLFFFSNDQEICAENILDAFRNGGTPLFNKFKGIEGKIKEMTFSFYALVSKQNE